MSDGRRVMGRGSKTSPFARLVLALVLLAAQTALAQVAQVVDSKGTSVVERAGAAPRILGVGERLDRLDTISVARASWAILEFDDRTRITLRPGTVFRIDSYHAGAPGSMLMGLVKGGFRVVTGLIGKSNPSAVTFQTATTTIGIRGTEFDARLCEDDCAAEERARPAPRPLLLPVARVVQTSGVVGAGRTGEPVRLLAAGSMLYEGDAVATGRNADAVLVFRDGARVSLSANSRFAIRRFQFDEVRPRDGSAYLTLYAGHALVATGQLAKIGPDAFLFRTALGVVRPFGTTFGGSGCIGSFCVSGNVTVNSDGASASGSVSSDGGSANASTSVDDKGASGSANVTKPTGGSVTITGNTSPPANPDNFAKLPAPGIGSIPTPFANLPSVNEVVEGVNEIVQTGERMLETVVQQAGETLKGDSRRDMEMMNRGLNTLDTAKDALKDKVSKVDLAGAARDALNAVRDTQAQARAEALAAEVRSVLDRLKNLPPDGPAARAALEQARQDLERLRGELQRAADATQDPVVKARLQAIGSAVVTVVAVVAVVALFGTAGVAVIAAALVTDALVVTSLTIMESTPELLITSAMALDAAGMGPLADKLRQAAATWETSSAADLPTSVLLVRALAMRMASGDVPVSQETFNGFMRMLDAMARGDQAALNAELRAMSGQGEADSSSQGKSMDKAIDKKPPATLAVWDGAVEVNGRMVSKGDMLLARADGGLTLVKTDVTAGPGNDLAKVDPDLFKSSGKDVDPGLYVWVRDGEVSVTKDGKTVDVAAGNAAVATKDKLELLGTVPGFLRFDATPLPERASRATAADAFKLPDGATTNMCVVK